jgi:hypothetical protein
MKTCIGVMVAITGLLPAVAAAQEPPVAAAAAAAREGRPLIEARGNVEQNVLPPGGPSPRMADGHVNLSGVWFAGRTGRANAWSILPRERVQSEPVPFQPWARARIDAMSQLERQLSSPSVRCEPVGTPGMFTMNHGYPSQIVMQPGLFVHLAEADNSWRVVHTDGRPHKPAEELAPLFNGDQTAHWEGDTLVIDSISFDERTWINGTGWFHSDELHVIERLRRPSMNYLEYQYSVEDPKVLTEPWTSGWDIYTLGSEDLIENFCTNNENIEQLQRLNEIQAGDAQ